MNKNFRKSKPIYSTIKPKKYHIKKVKIKIEEYKTIMSLIIYIYIFFLKKIKKI